MNALIKAPNHGIPSGTIQMGGQNMPQMGGMNQMGGQQGAMAF